MINFKIKDNHSDIKRLFEKPPDLDPSFVEKFKDEMRVHLKIPKNRVFLDDLDILGTFTSTSTLVMKGETPSRATNYKTRLGQVHKFSEKLQFDYCFVQKSPCEGRAAVIGDTGTINRIKWFHKAFREVCHCPEDQYSNPSVLEGLERWLTSHRSDVGYIMSDIKKSGLTFNRNLHNVIIEVLHEVMPSWGWDFFLNYGNAHILIEGQNMPISNGYGLGMMDCVISFAQAIIYNILVNESENVTMYHLTGKFWSDDSVVKARMRAGTVFEPEGLKGLMVEFNDYSSKCGIVIHDKKPYVSKTGVFLETYGTNCPKWSTLKASQYIGCLFNTLLCSDIVRAKEVFSALSLDVPSQLGGYISYALTKIISFWGYEFSPYEHLAPYECGGWSYLMERGFNNFFHAAPLLDNIPTMEDLLKLCTMPKQRKRFLRLHKVHKDYIDSIISIGWNQDPSCLSWERLSRATLLQDYNLQKDYVSVRTKVLKERADFWAKVKADKSHTDYHYMMEFYNTVGPTNWYIPPYSVVEACEPTEQNFSKVEYDPPREKPLLRSYYALSDYLGGNINIYHPNYSKDDYKSLAEDLLYQITSGRHMSLKQAVIRLVRGVSDDAAIMQLRNKLTGFYKFREPQLEMDELISLFQEVLGQGDYAFPVRELKKSITTNASPESMAWSKIPGLEYGKALFYKAYPMDVEGIIPYINLQTIKELDNELLEELGKVAVKPPLPPRLPKGPDKVPEESYDRLEEFKAMMSGFMAHLAANFTDHDERHNDAILNIADPYQSIFDEEGSEGIGDLFS